MASAFKYVNMGLHPNQYITIPHTRAQVLKSEETVGSRGPWLLLWICSVSQFSRCVCLTASSGSSSHWNGMKCVSAKTADYSDASFLDYIHAHTLFFKNIRNSSSD